MTCTQEAVFENMNVVLKFCRSPRETESVRGRPNRLNKPAAAYTAGAIMNLQMNADNRIALEQVQLVCIGLLVHL